MKIQNCRWHFVGLAFIAFATMFFLRVNMNICILAMTRPPVELNSSLTNTSTSTTQMFSWDEEKKGVILASFYVGYLFMQIPGGYLASKLGGRCVLGASILVSSLVSFLIPFVANQNFYVFVVLLGLNGVAQGPCFPGLNAMAARWTTRAEKSKMSTLIYTGVPVGTMLAAPFSALLASSSFLGGWPSVFYMSGLIGLLMFGFWCVFAYSDPNSHPWITDEERLMITDEQGSTQESMSFARVPWLKLFTSPACLSIYVGSIGLNWTLAVFLMGMPQFYADVLGFSLVTNGWFNALPYVVMTILSTIAGFAADWLRAGRLSTKNTRKLMCAASMLPSSVLLILTSYTESDQVALAVFYMTLGAGLFLVNTAGVCANMLDLTTNYAGIVAAVSNSIGTVCLMMEPVLMGYLINKNPSRGQYRKVMVIAAVISFVSCGFYLLFAKGERQSWDENNKKEYSQLNDDNVNEEVTEKSHLLA